MSDESLKPKECPFCGCNAAKLIDNIERFECRNIKCGIYLKTMTFKQWNTRHTTKEPERKLRNIEDRSHQIDFEEPEGKTVVFENYCLRQEVKTYQLILKLRDEIKPLQDRFDNYMRSIEVDKV